MSNLQASFDSSTLKFSLIFCLVFGTLTLTQGESIDADAFPLPCPSPIYCHGPLLKMVQLCKIFNESKTFVDLSMRRPQEEILSLFEALNFTESAWTDPIQCDLLETFVYLNLENGTEFTEVTFTDWAPSPPFLSNISDLDLREWASDLHFIWNKLGRQIREEVQESDRYSIIYSPNPMVVPGGRFREFYYWDSYWIQRGLLVSGMADTVRGMIDNFLDNVKSLGYVPNGGRIYYERSQPPLLLPMVDAYYEKTQDLAYLRENLWVMEKEFEFWMTNRTITFEKDGVNYTMGRYAVDRKEPRPEAFATEFPLVDALPKENQSITYSHLKSACESGWDFSTRWYKLEEWETGPVGFVHTKCRDIIPVDLNSFLYWNAVLLEKFCNLTDGGNCTIYADKAAELKSGIYAVLWDEELGSWFDYDWVRGSPRREFYASNISPLWVGGQHGDGPEAVTRILANWQSTEALNYPAGVPTSLIHSGQQWDFTNGWPPLVHIVVEAFENSGYGPAVETARQIAGDWVDANYIGWKVFNESMFEKYDVSRPGCPGGEGYYNVVLGFGWTNGVILDFLEKYGSFLVAPDVPTGLNCTGFSVYDHVVTFDQE